MSSGWDGILDDGEHILWQGRPDGRVVMKIGNILGFVFGLFFAGFALVWMVLAASAGGLFWMFGLLHFAVGIGMAFGSLFWDAVKRRATWYTLTDRRAFVATDLPLTGKTLESYPIDEDTRLSLTGAHPSSIHFATKVRRGKNRSYEVPIGFERLEDAERVYRLLRSIQTGAVGESLTSHTEGPHR